METLHSTQAIIRNQQGLSLVELMIALTISMFLLLGITTLIVQQSNTRNELEKSSRQIENGRYAMQILHDDIQHAGYYGEYFSISAPPAQAWPPAAGTTFDPCSSSVANLNTAMTLPLQGYNVAIASTAGSPIAACLADANYKAGTDILVIRRVGTTILTGAITASTSVLAQTTTTEGVLGTVSTAFNTNSPPLPSPFTLTVQTASVPAPLRSFGVHVYFISPCSVPADGSSTCTGAADDNGRPIPTLKMLDLTSAAPTTITPLVEGIEQMQLDFGVDTDGDGTPDSYDTPTTTTAWANVMTVRVNLLARNTECTVDHTESKTYNLGSAGSVTAPASDCAKGDYKRHVYTELVRAINPSGRREQ